MFRKPHHFIMALLLASSSPAIFAFNSTDFLTCFPWVVALSGGQVWEQAGFTQTLTLAPDIIKTYTANKESNTLAEGEIFIGIHQPMIDQVHGQFGLAFAATNNATLSGDIWDDGDPEFNNFTYQYKVNHKHIALKGKFVTNSDWPIQPWMSGSIGVGFNHAYGFSNTSTISEAVPNPNFTSQTTTTFTYTLGIGFQRKLTSRMNIGLGYEFADWGKSQLGKAPGQTQGNGLSLSHINTNGVMFNLTYVG